LLLADRALVLRDGVIAEEFVVDVPRPRTLDHPRILALRRALLQALGVNADLPTDLVPDLVTEETP
jgi:sulfonate transport system ATP-binding protein